MSDALDDPEREQYSVWLFRDDGFHAPACRWVKLRAAMEIATHCARHANTRHEDFVRVIVTDGGDSTIFAWELGKGITWPEERRGWQLKP
jgi:hypothetical protein